MPNVRQMANDMYRLASEDAALEAQIRSAHRELLVGGATSKTAWQTIVSSTVNGQSFTVANSLPADVRFRMLSLCIRALDAGAPISAYEQSGV